MSKCIRCGGSFLTRRRVKLQDADICGKCFLELGFSKSDYIIAPSYSYKDIKDGLEAYVINKYKQRIKDDIVSGVSVRITGSGEHDLICTEEEREIFEILKQIAAPLDIPQPLRLVRKSDNYVSAVIGEYDLARIKYTNRAKWLSFPHVPPGSEKHRIESVADVQDMAELVEKAVESIKTSIRYSSY